MNVFITYGTQDYLRKVKEEYAQETMVLMHKEEDQFALLHETEEKTVFNEAHTYEVLDAVGNLPEGGFAVLNNIPVSDEGRPLFEHRFNQRARLIEKEPGFAAIRVLRPLKRDTYIILTMWKDEQSFKNWQESKAYDKAHKKRGTSEGVDQQSIFPRPSYVTHYQVIEG
ncbi:antibiotic biosynthesis monooxygenase [Bacillus sp. CGMCC 1.16541]|uniref:antibiotic biosynthesis monooxygenase family protein n=1 Tax=Bacillus sp. CGMCC 1.16541 TaxID=2185143 RepID=UPI000D733A9D|nr:antibiotic biosynthesis monooxygenase [Bacillus sp. CGMCC 1.16541]